MIKPMLAKKFVSHDKLTKFFAVQPKLNGVRCIYVGGDFYSRDQKVWNKPVLKHIFDSIPLPLHQYVLDGELYLHRQPLQTINGAISVNRLEPNERTVTIEYHIFDLIDPNHPDKSFYARNLKLIGLVSQFGPKLKLVETHFLENPYHAEGYYSRWKNEGYEGMMYRDAEAAYGFEHNCSNKENRWSVLLKRKEWLDEEFPILDIQEGKGELAGTCGALVLQAPNGKTFTAGSGLNLASRRAYFNHPPIGRVATIKFETYSLDGIPLKPTVELVHD